MVVADADTVVDPGAMMIESFHTFVANTAMSGSGSSDNLTVGAKKDWVKVLQHVLEIKIR